MAETGDSGTLPLAPTRWLAECEREVLHLSGAIQPHGVLLVADGGGRLCHVSDNVGALLGGAAGDWLGQTLPDELGSLSAVLPAAPGSRLVREAAFAGEAGWLDAVLTRAKTDAVLVELTLNVAAMKPSAVTPPSAGQPADEEELALQRQALIEYVMALTGFQRVMYYQFRDDGDGEVINEARLSEVYGSYLGHRFPASDIPQIARLLYLKNRWRLIPDATAEPVPLVGEGLVDLTFADLRSVSPVHRVYLANMGVRASLSFPVIVGGQLDALIAAHHSKARRPSLGQLERIAFEVQRHACSAGSLRAARRIRLIDGLARRFEKLREVLLRHGPLVAALGELCPWLMQEFDADGAMILRGDVIATSGECFEPAALAVFDQWFCERQRDLVWMGDSLSRQVPLYPHSGIAGVLAIRIHHSEGCPMRLYLCRHEFVEEVSWGGNPQKPVEYHDGLLGIGPRRSFEKWVEKRLGYSRSWNNEARLLAMKLRELLQKETGYWPAGH